jgi:hypothetical protein
MDCGPNFILNNLAPDADPEQATLKQGINVPDWSRRGLSDRSNRLGTFSFASLAPYGLGRPFSEVLQAGDPRTIFIEKTLGAFLIRVADRSTWMLSSS